MDSPALIQALKTNIGSALLGKPDAIRLALVALLAEGHVLIEDAPGVGKTVLAKALAKSLDCEFRRLQFTPDLLPSDIVGASVFLPQQGLFEFRPGPLFTNILFADEINRTTPRTQSALLEAMAEGQISVDGQTYALKRPFFVIATQNPYEFEGTYPLPENQLDRFMVCLDIGYPDRKTEREVLVSHRSGEPVDQIRSVVSLAQLQSLQQAAREVKVEESLNEYVLDIIEATRKHEELSLGVSTRGAVSFYRAVQALALIEGRNYAVPDDIKLLSGPVLAHRVVPKGLLREGLRQRNRTILQQILNRIPVPR
jgi:MoxR-like ATPase